MMARRALQVVADGAPGGGTTAVLGLSEDLSRRGWRISIATQTASYAAAEAARVGFDVYELDFFRSRLDRRLPSKLRHLIRHICPDLIHAHGARAAFPLRRVMGETPLVYTVHGYHFPAKRPPLRWLAQSAEQMIARSVDHLILVSEGDRSIGLRTGVLTPNTPASVIHNGIEPSDFPETQGARKIYDVAFVGRLEHQKNPLLFVETVAGLAARRGGIRAVLVGGGRLEAAVRARAEALGITEAIDFKGALPRDAALGILAQSRIYLFPSLWEGLPIAPIEAMYLGLPVVASRVSGTDEVVVDGETGLLIAGHDAAAYSAAVRSLLDDPAKAAGFSAAGKQRVADLFSRRACAAATEAIYEALLSNGRAAGVHGALAPVAPRQGALTY
jgi:glycosyltransferase involved in cell wall biosynthesis